MITRKEPTGGLLVIGQTDHSRLVGQLAAHWGNATFAPLKPYESMVRAATFHDYGWLRYETSPLLDPQTGEPYSFLKVPLTAARLEAYQWSLDWMAEIDRYAGLIVSMHRTGLWRGRYGAITHPGMYSLKHPSPEIEALIERNEAWQERERALHDPDNVWTNYHLLQVWDLLGLYFCCQAPYDEYVEPVPTGYPSPAAAGVAAGGSNGGVRLTLRPTGPRRVAFEPYPFDRRPCRIQLACRRLPQASFADLEAFRRSYFQADLELMEFELV
jgi:hypothetical protein